MYKIFDDIADLNTTKEFYQSVMQNDFPWFFSSCVNPSLEVTRTRSEKPYFISPTRFNLDQKVMSHMAWIDGMPNSVKYADRVKHYVDDFCSKVGITYDVIIRAQFNLLFRHPSNLPSCPHVDQTCDHGVLLFYLHDGDGETIILDDYANEIDKVMPKENRVLVFDGTQLHSGGCPQHIETRVVLNVNLHKMIWSDNEGN